MTTVVVNTKIYNIEKVENYITFLETPEGSELINAYYKGRDK
jgi:hypothetical protein